ncbi:hypothetical protein [Chelativorans salis]|uniref:Uncharacterized protein n=1 Tax=Chelativorans salis TaxID=2978478 RepID=A0ABT2LPF6_9HYPH|nr:hypothetical protein [Chelativorans sp. EGI FJ00035]MCT7376186.1 hypothetical protein [Chelativorans sp. EGI FJ00035]
MHEDVMPPSNHKKADASEAARLILQQIHTAENLRFLRHLPGFELDRELPTLLLQSLGRLHRAEEGAKAPKRRGKHHGTGRKPGTR